MEGVCIVVSPLVALMKDQVEQLKRRGIIAAAIYSGMSRSEIDLHLNNALYSGIKFLYVSPERLKTEIFIERFKRMKVSLLAVDEAHCISQWGYDFRPPYLEIADLRQWQPTVPILALTATATPQVADDIQQRLGFGKSARRFSKSFARDNLSFVVRKTDSKERKLFEILNKVAGSAIVYVRSRKATEQLAAILLRNHISASAYHAGLAHALRDKLQNDWIENRTRVIVATNAFGMGIDKPDVRVVVHMDIPDNLEAYYQEAGRAGRDGHPAFAAVLFQAADVDNLQTKVTQSQPDVAALRQTYRALVNHFQLAMGSGAGESYDFDMVAFCERFTLQQQPTYYALKKLEESGLILFNESYYAPSQLHVTVDNVRLYEFQIANEKFDPLIKMLLRLHGGELFNDFTRISENQLADGLGVAPKLVRDQLSHLHKLQVVHYQPQKETPQVTFLLPRQDVDRLPIDTSLLTRRRELVFGKMKAMIAFVTEDHRCRMQRVQEYFGENTFALCEKCDVCVARRKRENSKSVTELREQILRLVGEQAYTLDELESRISPDDTEVFVELVRDLVDEGRLKYDKAWRLLLA